MPLSEGTRDEIRDSILEARMWSAQSLRDALLIALRNRGFIASIARCEYKPGAGYCIKGQVVWSWSALTDQQAERGLSAVMCELKFTNFGWTNRMQSRSQMQLDYYAECGVFRD